ncbi:Quinolinate phosphoribosyl transferase [Scenedesmus sp. NREL 46B-D3]|nr:Quinolinate phosphoribosyl transferase [Scenedesmus sp. NREL 46B-D3]
MSAATATNKPAAPPTHPTYNIKAVIAAALAEDAGNHGDITTLSTIPESTQASATFLAKADGVLAGLAVANLVCEMVDPALKITWSLQDGDAVQRGVEFGVVAGSARSILVAERVCLNFMQRMSGIATATAAMVAAAAGHKAKILDTRKTAPGLRLLDKWAVALGGGTPHRMGLFDMMMIKDNHIAAAGGISQAVAAAEAYIQQHGLDEVQVEVETSSLDQVQQVLDVLASGAAPHVTRVMLDNMTRRDASCLGGVDVSLLKQAVAQIAGKVQTEASGNVTLESVAEIASAGVDFISVGALTHSVKALDISLNVVTR